VVRRSPVKRETHGFESHSLSQVSGCSSACVERVPRAHEVAPFKSCRPDFLRRMPMELHRPVNDLPAKTMGSVFHHPWSPLTRVRRNRMRASPPNWREWVQVPSLAFRFAAVAQRMRQPSRKRQDVGSIPTGGSGCLKLGDRLTGRMADSDSVDRGSNPCLPAKFRRPTSLLSSVIV
jgi:hypothetical protein